MTNEEKKAKRWCVKVSTRHTGEWHGSDRYATEAEAHAAAMREQQKFKGCGVYYEAALHWDDGEDEVTCEGSGYAAGCEINEGEER